MKDMRLRWPMRGGHRGQGSLCFLKITKEERDFTYRNHRQLGSRGWLVASSHLSSNVGEGVGG